jgi:hypothetical protein
LRVSAAAAAATWLDVVSTPTPPAAGLSPHRRILDECRQMTSSSFAHREKITFFFRHKRNLIKKQPLLLYNTEISSFLEKYEKKNEMFQKRRR